MRDEVEGPINQNNPIRLSTPPVLIVLNRKYHTEGSERKYRVPESEINQPIRRIGFDLESGLEGSCEYQRREDCLVEIRHQYE